MNINSQEWIDSNIEHLTEGEMEITGRLVDASNATLFGSITRNDISVDVIYKPMAGERPLWDFPDGTLADREYSAFLLSRLSGLNLIPPTILRDGPAGMGMVQLWIDVDESINLASYFSQDDPQLRKLALFDACINNTDRKIGHLLPDSYGNLFACDHGVTFHVEDKLRTVLWQWAGDQLTTQEIDLLSHLGQIVQDHRETFSAHLTGEEIDVLIERIKRLIVAGTMPLPSEDWPAIPWPAY